MASSCSPEQLESVEEVYGLFYSIIGSWHLLCSLVNVVVTTMTWIKAKNSTAPINSKKLHKFYFLYTYVYLLSFSIIEVLQFVDRFLLGKSGCALLRPVRFCVWFRILQSAYAVFFIIFKIGVLFDKASMEFWKDYKESSRSQWINGTIMVILSLGLVSYSLFEDLASDEFQVKCSSLEHKSKIFQAILFSALIFIIIILYTVYITWKFYLDHKRYDSETRWRLKRINSYREIDQHLESTSWNVIIIISASLWYGIWSLSAVVVADITASIFLISYSIPTANLLHNILLLIKFHKCPAKTKVQSFNETPVFTCCQTEEVFTTTRGDHGGSSRSPVSRNSLVLHPIQ